MVFVASITEEQFNAVRQDWLNKESCEHARLLIDRPHGEGAIELSEEAPEAIHEIFENAVTLGVMKKFERLGLSPLYDAVPKKDWPVNALVN